MNDKILKWLSGHDTGESSRAIAHTALGQMPDHPSYPSDRSDFGRCYRLLVVAPDARIGLVHLGQHGGSAWQALVAQWDEIECAYLDDLKTSSDRRAPSKCYALMKSILDPIEDADPSIVRFAGGKLHTPRSRSV